MIAILSGLPSASALGVSTQQPRIKAFAANPFSKMSKLQTQRSGVAARKESGAPKGA